ncbi:MAG: Lrp/AsnC family transcriptional regulator [Pseudomonadota bacterium]
MMMELDKYDRAILTCLQDDALISMDHLAERVHLSRNACWRRIKQMETARVIQGRSVIVDPAALDLGLSVLVMIRTNAHDADWVQRFQSAIATIPEVLGAHRMTGDLDYVLRLRVADVADYDRVYQQLIRRVPIADISASFVMEDLKDTRVLPTHIR